MTVSDNQLEANRRKAQLSTGPRTPEGKASSSLNALKHGIFSRDITASSLTGESPEVFDALLTELTDAFQPAGGWERLLLEQLAVLHWRLWRVQRTETAEIDAAVLAEPRRLHRARVDLAESSVDAIVTGAADFDITAASAPRDLVSTSAGLHRIVELLHKARHELSSAGVLGSETHAGLCALLPDSSPLVDLLTAPDTLGADSVAAAIQDAIARFTAERDELQAYEQQLDSALCRALAIPAPRITDKLIRYEKLVASRIQQTQLQLERV